MTQQPVTTTNIPILLRQQGRSVTWFCRQVGIHRSYYWMMERGRRPLAASYLSRAADVLGVPVSLLSTDRSILALETDRETVHAA